MPPKFKEMERKWLKNIVFPARSRPLFCGILVSKSEKPATLPERTFAIVFGTLN